MDSKFGRKHLKYFTPLLFVLAALLFSLNAYSQDEDYLALFNKGQDAHEQGNFENALKLYDDALKILPEFPEALYQKGSALLSLKKTEEAEKAFRQAIDLRADWSLPLTSLGSILVKRGGLPEAEKLLLKAISLDEFNFPAYAALAELRLRTNAPAEILKELLSRLVNISSKRKPTAAIWAARGAIERSLRDKESARKSLAAALSLAPDDQFARSEKIMLALSDGDAQGALEDAKKLAASADSAENKLLLARAYAENDDKDKALAILDALDGTDKKVSELKIAIIASKSENAADLEKILEKEPKNAVVLGRLCTLMRIADPIKSMNYCRLASEAEPTNPNHAIGFARALIQAKQYEPAAGVLRKIIELIPDNYSAHTNLALALFQLKRYEEAKKEYQWISEAKPDIAATYFFLAICHDNLQEYLDSMANYQRFLKLADAKANQLEIEKVNLRLPILQRQIKNGEGKKKK